MPAEKFASTTTGDAQDNELHTTAKSAEDRKAASALASLDAAGHDDPAMNNRDVDREAVNKAMRSLGDGAKPASAATVAPSRNIKVDDADVAVLVDQLEVSKANATDLLKAHDGDAVKAMRTWVNTEEGK
ncbi:hypothetical protein E4U30_006940 [Claviceps sp. LM220 group G6]|nr:hypothetical protein E4U15_006780 [Claviceps sp. LM218 group G6]KAG6091444.1 hypothetical protein E4U30_006940 [Claviceps sp. LM220 group G6]KAG6100378.1 hypothetical protein E4U14_007073 [Claviceps sp. LM454 group G7]